MLCCIIISSSGKYQRDTSNQGPQAIEDHGEGEKPYPRGKTNSKKEEKRDATPIVLHETLQGMMTQKKTREEKRQQDKEEQMKAYMERQRKKHEMKAKMQAKKFKMEAEMHAKKLEIKAGMQAKKLEIEATKANKWHGFLYACRWTSAPA